MEIFPIIRDGEYDLRLRRGEKLPPYPKVPWKLLAPHEEQALKNHSQTLDTLASRGGLSPQEMIYIIKNKNWKIGESIMKEKDAILELNILIKKISNDP